MNLSISRRVSVWIAHILPQSGPDVTGRLGSCSEAVKPISAHNVAITHHPDADKTYSLCVVRESFKVELSPPVKFCEKFLQYFKDDCFSFPSGLAGTYKTRCETSET